MQLNWLEVVWVHSRYRWACQQISCFHKQGRQHRIAQSSTKTSNYRRLAASFTPLLHLFYFKHPDLLLYCLNLICLRKTYFNKFIICNNFKWSFLYFSRIFSFCCNHSLLHCSTDFFGLKQYSQLDVAVVVVPDQHCLFVCFSSILHFFVTMPMWKNFNDFQAKLALSTLST